MENEKFLAGKRLLSKEQTYQDRNLPVKGEFGLKNVLHENPLHDN